MNGNLYRIVADLVKSKGSEDLSSKLQRLRDEIKKVTEGQDTMFGKLRSLVESLQEIIPDEKQRYNAALKALTTTLKLSRREIIKAINDQIDELNILEKRLLSGIPGWRDELKVMQAASQDIRDDIAKLHEKIARLEGEEKVILAGMATREKEMAVVETATRELFSEIVTHISAVASKLDESTIERAPVQPIPSAPHPTPRPVPPVAQPAPQPVPPVAQPAPLPIPPVAQATPPPAAAADAVKSDAPAVEQKSEAPTSPVSPAAELQKKCPMCGSKMDFHMGAEKWICYTCAYEEAGSMPGTRQEQSVEAIEGLPSSAPKEEAWLKKCSMCGGKMDFFASEKKWMCYTCGHEEAGTGEVPGTREQKKGQASPSEPGPASMEFHAPSPAPDLPLTDLTSSEFQQPVRGSIGGSAPSSGMHQPMKKKPCPGCKKKMQFYEEEKTWRCPHCGYERRVF